MITQTSQAGDPLDISLDLDSDSFVHSNEQEPASESNQPNSPEFGPRGFQSFVYSTPQPTNPARIALQVEDISDSDDIKGSEEDISTRRNDRDTDYATEAAQFPIREENAVPLPPLVISSPADLINLVPRRKSSDGNNISDVSHEYSISEDEFSNSSEETTSESTTTRSCRENNLEA